MKNLKDIIEGLKIGSKTKVNSYKPKDKWELKDIIRERLKKDKDANLNDIDISGIKDMSFLFSGLDPHNIDISRWDVSNVINMYSMFYKCKNFNSDLSGWDVSKVIRIDYMFFCCNNFNSDLSNWDISKVTRMTNMFGECTSLKNKPSWYKK